MVRFRLTVRVKVRVRVRVRVGVRVRAGDRPPFASLSHGDTMVTFDR